MKDERVLPMRGMWRIPLRAFACLSLALIVGCAGTRKEQPRTVPEEPPVTVICRLAVAIEGRPRSFPAEAIHLMRTDLIPTWRLTKRAVAGNSPVRSLGPAAEGWYAVDLVPGRYHLNVASKWHFPTPRGVPPLLLEIVPGDRYVYAGTIRVNCRDRVWPDKSGSQLYDCDAPTIHTDEAATAAERSSATSEPAIRAARPLSELTRPQLPMGGGPWVLEPEREEAADLPLQVFPQVKQAGQATAQAAGVAAVNSLACGPFFAFCLAVLHGPVLVTEAAIEGGVEHHGNKVRGKCSERLTRELLEFRPQRRLRAALRERFAASAPGAPAPAIVLRVTVLRIGVRGDTCLPGFNPFKLSDRYRADILASVQAVDDATGTVLYEELLSNTETLSPWDIVAGRGSLSPVGDRAPCRRVKEFCSEEDEAVLNRDLEPAIDAFADHVLRVLTTSRSR